MSEYSSLIDKHFLSTFLSEEVNELTDDISDLSIKENIELSDISDFLIKLENMDINDNIKYSYLERLTRLYSEQVDTATNEAVIVFNEYAGNAEQNKVLVQLMSEMEKNLQEFFDDTYVGIKALNQMVDILKTEASKKSPDAKDAARKIREIYKRIDSEFTAANGRRQTYSTTFKNLVKICKKFGIKFSDVAMEEKKAFDKKLKLAYDKMYNNKDFSSWLAKSPNEPATKITEVNDYLDELKIDSKDTVVTMVNDYIQPVYNYMFICMTGYMGNINYLRKMLKLEKEDGIFYKAINHIFKTNK